MIAFNRFDICDAYYVYAANYHGGQYTDTYRIFGRLEKIGYRPSSNLSEDSLEENARLIYDRLVEKDTGDYDEFLA